MLEPIRLIIEAEDRSAAAIEQSKSNVEGLGEGVADVAEGLGGATKGAEELGGRLEKVSEKFKSVSDNVPGAEIFSSLIEGTGGVVGKIEDVKAAMDELRNAGDGGPQGVDIGLLEKGADSAAELSDKLEGVRNKGLAVAAVGAGGIAISQALQATYEEGQLAEARLEAVFKAQNRLADLGSVNDTIGDIATRGHFADDDEIRQSTVLLANWETKTKDIPVLLEAAGRQAQLTGQSIEELSNSFGKSVATGNYEGLKRSAVSFSEVEEAAIKAGYAISQEAGQAALVESIHSAVARTTGELGSALSDTAKTAQDAARQLDDAMTAAGEGAAGAQQNIDGLKNSLITMVAVNPDVAKGAGAVLTYGSYALTAGGSVVALGAQLGQLFLAYQVAKGARMADTLATEANSVAQATNSTAQAVNAEATAVAGGAATVATRGFHGLSLAEAEAAAAGRAVASAAAGPQTAGAAAIVAAREFDALTAAEERAAIAGRGVGVGAAGAAAAGTAAGVGTAAAAVGGAGAAATAGASGVGATLAGGASLLSKAKTLLGGLGGAASAATAGIVVGVTDAASLLHSAFTGASDKDLQAQGQGSLALSSGLQRLFGLDWGTVAVKTRGFLGFGRPDVPENAPSAPATPSATPTDPTTATAAGSAPASPSAATSLSTTLDTSADTNPYEMPLLGLKRQLRDAKEKKDKAQSDDIQKQIDSMEDKDRAWKVAHAARVKSEHAQESAAKKEEASAKREEGQARSDAAAIADAERDNIEAGAEAGLQEQIEAARKAKNEARVKALTLELETKKAQAKREDELAKAALVEDGAHRRALERLAQVHYEGAMAGARRAAAKAGLGDGGKDDMGKARDAKIRSDRAIQNGGFGSTGGFLPGGLRNGDGFRPAVPLNSDSAYPMDSQGMVQQPSMGINSKNEVTIQFPELTLALRELGINLASQRGRRPR